jgi:ElaB/YqjD/DUF883 family membrane-anchored ribosome-binding protein
MSEIKQRLQETAENCLKQYEAWDAKKSDSETRENLQEAIHDLRKVASRLEIEIAISERENISSKPIAIPQHRSQSKAKGAVESILPENTNTSGDSGKSDQKPRRRQQRRPSKKSD